MNDSRSFEAVTRDLRSQENAGEKVIASVSAFRPAAKAKITLANASIMLGNVESIMRDTAALRDELRLNAFPVEAQYVRRNEAALDRLYDRLLATANTLVAKATPIAPLGACEGIVDTINTALMNGGQEWTMRLASFAETPLLSFVLATFTRTPYVEGDAKLVVIVSVTYPDTLYNETAARYALSVFYQPMEVYAWEASDIHRSFSVNLGAANSRAAIGARAVSIIADRLERDDVSLRMQRKVRQPRRANEIRADDICGMSELPIAVMDIDAALHTITVGVALPGAIGPQALVALGREIKRRTINQLVITDIQVTEFGMLNLVFAANTDDLTLAAERLRQLAASQ